MRLHAIVFQILNWMRLAAFSETRLDSFEFMIAFERVYKMRLDAFRFLVAFNRVYMMRLDAFSFLVAFKRV